MSGIAAIRKDYRMHSFDDKDAASNPFDQFTRWWHDAIKSEIEEVNAMTLCTISPEGIPAGRIVLLKGYDNNGFVFFTNYESDKGKHLSAHPTASLVFFWKEIERQVRITGRVERISSAESDDYFNSRPEGSKLGAWASAQSEIIEDRKVIETRLAELTQQFADKPVPRPPHWGGYRVIPDEFEFWQGRPSRLHDRIRYLLVRSGWIKQRLSP